MNERNELANYCEYRFVKAFARRDQRAMRFWARCEYRASYGRLPL